ncbi:DUF2637 domain-containing protein [Streptomyces sp. NE06-03E]|uniref:DUF2637 domain-containing protein n=2 Tax=Streptomyces TaxID=1883 RepID=A0A652KSL5_9ACTN|nr:MULTISPECIES: DUF2637 domain-containing protein [unclassified Streptomyces]WSS69595.1 DUF2637 domain-containing protein [Streptomyces sp. NBC_01175]MDX3053780.1 DUF2637 domain-containing protein [Streptomyces sp. NE06-03E]MDX3324816.1 DUF2637 domain-containing protein [Streptomyces sp. ME02-6979-3A]MDX3688301.1 DUF2637 domain-containing protein [Streptomyces sp. AK04-4c]TXS26719.1 DUF2637 domain-containing protein [Streptomyces sp. gb1(2016)]
MAAMQLTRTHRVLIGVVVAGAVLIAAIGFAGSYAAVRELAEEKGFGEFSVVFPIGIDAGICVLLALDLLLTWMRIPFPLLRQTAWLLTAATIAFNGAAAWPDPLGTGMHAVIPILFVVAVEAARHAVGRIADITADKHMEGVRLTRWLLSPVPTFKLWRRMKLWELRSYEQVIKLEQDRLIYQARLQARFGRNWRRKAPVESMMPLRLAKYGVPLAETAPAGLAAAGIEPALLPPAPAVAETAQQHPQLPYAPEAQGGPEHDHRYEQDEYDQQDRFVQQDEFEQQYPPEGPGSHHSPWFAAPKDEVYDGGYNPAYDEGTESNPVMIPSGPGRTRPLGNVGTIGAFPHPRSAEPEAEEPQQQPEQDAGQEADPAEWAEDEIEFSEIAYEVFTAYTHQHQDYPSAEVLDIHLSDGHNVRHPRSAALLRRMLPGFKQRFNMDEAANHIA